MRSNNSKARTSIALSLSLASLSVVFLQPIRVEVSRRVRVYFHTAASIIDCCRINGVRIPFHAFCLTPYTEVCIA